MKRYIKLFIFILILLITFVLFTPSFFSNFLIGKVSGDIKFRYAITNYNNNVIEYTFNHKKYDGDLMSMTIKKKIDVSNKKYNSNLLYYNYQKVFNPKVPNYSSFTNICSYILSRVLKNTDKKIKVGVIVSKRNCLKDKFKSGNYFNIATYKVDSTMNLESICKIHNDTVKKVKNNCKKINLKMYDFLHFHSCNIIFNSHRDLSYIEREDGYKLIRLQLPEELPSLIDIQKMYNFKNKKQLLVLNNYNNDWMITKIVIPKKMKK